MDNSKSSTIYLATQKGFTLVEVLIAIVLLAFISLYTFKMVDNSTDTKEKVVKEDKLLLQTLIAVSRIDSDFSQLYSPLYSYSKEIPTNDPNSNVYQDTSVPRGSFDGKVKNGMIIPQFKSEDKASIILFTSANRRKVADAKESRYTWVKYSLRTSDKNDPQTSEEKKSHEGGGQEIIRQTISSNIYANDLNWNDTKAQVLLTQVKSLEFSFWDERAKKFQTSIQDLNEIKNQIRSIRMQMVWIDEDNHEQKVDKTYRVGYPFFNSKLDDIKMNNGAYGGDGTIPPGVPDPTNPTPGGGSSQGGGSDVHY